jgi:PKD repeat protein
MVSPYLLNMNPLHTYATMESNTVSLTVTDDDGGVGTDTLMVTVNNVEPVIDKIAFPIDPCKVNTPVAVSSTFTDAGILDTHTAVWDWGDGTTSAGIVTETNGAGTVTGDHTYTSTGIYRVVLTVTDDDGGIASKTSENYVVVYDSAGGFVTGGGWINSPVGAYVPDSTMSGKAAFEFASTYTKKATIPTGITMFQLKMSKVGNGPKSTKTTNLNFKSTSYDWLVVSGNQAKCKGTGTINGKGNYDFMISIVDGKNKKNDIDKFRIKIWDKASGAIVYDNEIGALEDVEPSTAIGGGSIVVHKVK